MTLPVKAKPLSLAKRDRLWRNLTAIEQAHGGRAGLRETLEFSGATGPRRRFLDLLYDPARVGDSLRTLCRDANLAPMDLLEMLQHGASALAMAEAQVAMADALPTIVADVTAKAQDHFVPCTCADTPEGPQPPDPGCPLCKGNGYLRREASYDHQKLIFEATKLLPRAGGVNIRNENKTLVMPSGDAFDRFVTATDGAPALPALEAEVLPDE